jgi:hypothetical protein
VRKEAPSLAGKFLSMFSNLCNAEGATPGITPQVMKKKSEFPRLKSIGLAHRPEGLPESLRKVAQFRRGRLFGREAHRTPSKVGVQAAVRSMLTTPRDNSYELPFFNTYQGLLA